MRVLFAMAAASALLALFPPAAAALDALPSEDRIGPTEARFLVRVRSPGPVHVEADAPVRIALARHGETPDALVAAPADLRAPPGASWHGLPGVVELVVERDDPSRPVIITAWQDDGGVAIEWAAVKRPTPGMDPLLVALAAGVGVLALRRR
jgi:hypothetical protein